MAGQVGTGLGGIGQQEVIIAVAQHIGDAHLGATEQAEGGVIGHGGLGQIHTVFQAIRLDICPAPAGEGRRPPGGLPGSCGRWSLADQDAGVRRRQVQLKTVTGEEG